MGGEERAARWPWVRRWSYWAFRVDDGPQKLTAQQDELLLELEKVLSSFGPQPADQDAAISALRPLVLALRESGLSARLIADHSRIRPESVDRLLD